MPGVSEWIDGLAASLSFISRSSWVIAAAILVASLVFWVPRVWSDSEGSSGSLNATGATPSGGAPSDVPPAPSTGAVTTAPVDLASCDFRNEIDRVRGATVLVQVTYQDRTGASGTAFHLGGGRFVTAAHVVLDEGGRPAASITIESAVTRQQYAAALVTVGAAPELAWSRDLAVLSATEIPDSVLWRIPQESDVDRDVRAVGYPWSLADDGALLSPPLVVRGTLAFLGTVNGIEVAQFSARAEQGMSGGPLVDECGTVLAVTSGANLRMDDWGTLREGFGVFISMAELERLP